MSTSSSSRPVPPARPQPDCFTPPRSWSTASPGTDLAALRLDAKWHAVLDLCEALALLGDGPRAERLYAHLAPYSGLHAAAARAVVWYGPVDHFLGLLALTAGDPARAEGHLVAALQEGGGDRRRAPGGVDPRAARPGPRGDGRVRA